MRAKVKWLIIVVVLLAIASILLVDSVGTNDQKPEVRLSWQEQLARVQRVMAEVDHNATVYRIHASLFYDENNTLKQNDQNGPLPIMQISFIFDGSSPGKQHTLSYYDVMTGSFSVDTYTIEPKSFDSIQMGIGQLTTTLPVGPLDICQSTVAVVKGSLKVAPTKINCGMMLTQHESEQEEFNIPVVWFVTLYIYEGKKASQQVNIWVDPATGEQLKLVRRCPATGKTTCDIVEPTSQP